MNDNYCERVRALISEYVDGDLTPEQERVVDTHMQECRGCKAVLDGMRNVVALAGDERIFQPPKGFSTRLYSKLKTAQEAIPIEAAPAEVPLGITRDSVPVGSHLIYFWQSNSEFESGVRFLYPGLGKDEHCIIFGHAEALEHVQEVLASDGYDPAKLIAERKLTVLHRHANAPTTISEIGAAVEAALAQGSRMVRFLGNLGLGVAPLPAGEDDVLELESQATALMSSLPCVVVCMYDVRTVPGRLIIKGGLETHKLSVCADGVRENPFFVGDHDHGSHHIH